MGEIKRVDAYGETFYVKKSFGEYRVVHPVKNEDGNWNWFNLLTGGWNNLIFVIILVLLLLFIAWSYKHDIGNCREVILNPCKFCWDNFKP